MPKLVKFKEVNGSDVFVNVERVLNISRDSEAGTTLVQFDNEHFMHVEAKIDSAVMAVNQAFK